METPKEYHYTYYSYEEYGRGYFGSRTCRCLPEEDIKYFGSFSDKTFKPTQKIILKIYTTREEAYIDEILLHNFYDVANNPHFANKAKQTSARFCVSKEKLKELGKNVGKLMYKNKGGAFGITHEERKLAQEKANKTNKTNGTGLYSITKEQRINQAKKSNETNKINGTGIYSITLEERIEISKKVGRKTYEMKIGVHGLTPEQRTEYSRKGGKKGGKNASKITNSQKWMCTETGYITTSGALTHYQKHRGIDTSKRKRIS
jgi:hypothetical protein